MAETVWLEPEEKYGLSEVGFEPTPPFGDQKPLLGGSFPLESGALDHSAILTAETNGSERVKYSIVSLCFHHVIKFFIKVYPRNGSVNPYKLTETSFLVRSGTLAEFARLSSQSSQGPRARAHFPRRSLAN